MWRRTAAAWLAWSLWAVCVVLIGLAFMLDFVTDNVPVPVYVHALHYRVMRLFKSWRLARMAPLLAIVSLLCLLCIWAFLSLLPTGLEVPAVLTKARSSHVNQETKGEWHSLDGSYLAVPPEEKEEGDKHPVNADLLSALLLLACSLGATVVWLLINGRGKGTFRSLGIDRRRWFLSALEARPFWGVFRL